MILGIVFLVVVFIAITIEIYITKKEWGEHKKIKRKKTRKRRILKMKAQRIYRKKRRYNGRL